ncbi:hypothetical protein [Streptomyces sp. NPDC001536]|uniref:hypothetical protein n=1 Tax=Streptomyces sp. NPDC001536 TaxID=3364583 RepID=UPI003696C536
MPGLQRRPAAERGAGPRRARPVFVVSAARLAELAAQLPVVSVARRLRPLTDVVDIVRAADDEGARQAVDHLVALHHRDIGHIDGGKAPGAADRRRGYKLAEKSSSHHTSSYEAPPGHLAAPEPRCSSPGSVVSGTALRGHGRGSPPRRERRRLPAPRLERG